MLVKAIFETESLEELDEIEGDLIYSLTNYARNNPDTSSTLDKYIEEKKIIIKVFKLDNIN